ncbi:MFS transporter [Leucobacter luti]|uniref:MFS transporter n=1 Tax=Leucobacter luti TaxID=340320 RepID=UPI00104BA1B4|nr:MFS transporter [Leucobacter luti]MCW2289433.1 putative MFS family arabinose efflux permease [Leucobacter luti]QYM74799.1 MFS transporter [Leucobacter luti]
MSTPDAALRLRSARRWTLGVLAVFALLGTGFGSWLSRLPAVRDHLGATTLEMSVFGLTLALGSLAGLIFSGRTVTWLGPQRTLAVGVIGQAIAMPAAAALFWAHLPVPAAACLAVFGITFATSDVAMNVSGAAAERALDKPRMPLFHAAYSLGSVGSMGLGAVAEALKIPVPVHLGALFVLIAVGVLCALRVIPNTAQSSDHEQLPPASVHTGPIPIVAAAEPVTPVGPAPRAYSPWRDPRILIIGVIAMSMSLAEGTASDWLPLALADGRGFANEAGALTLGAFFVAMTLTRIAGSWLLTRFGRVAVLRGGALLVVLGVVVVILVPSTWASVVGAVLWGVGCAFGFPVGISAAADNPKTAVRDVAAVSAIAYTAYLLGPMLIGFLGEHFGLLRAFWPIVVFAAIAFICAGTAREPARKGLAEAS